MRGSASPAFAHISFANREARAGGTCGAVLNIEHGCQGSPTTAVPSWSRWRHPWRALACAGLDARHGDRPYGEPVQHLAEALNWRIREITWSGGSLPEGGNILEPNAGRGGDDGQPGALAEGTSIVSYHVVSPDGIQGPVIGTAGTWEVKLDVLISDFEGQTVGASLETE